MRLLMAAGGTGGHVFPALAIARAMKAAEGRTEVLFVGTSRGLETTLVPDAGFALRCISIGGVKKMGWFRRLRNLLRLPLAFYQSRKVLREFSPQVVFGIGGYASGPVLLMAALGGFQTAILEPNAAPGFSNRILSRFVHRVFLAFEEAKEHLPKKKCVVSGNPIRAEILAVLPPNFEAQKRTILIFGGSQGARRLNDSLIDALPRLAARRDRIAFIHQTGTKDFERVQEAYREQKMEADVRPFINDMAQAYSRSDLVLARSGSSVLEIAACGRPSILVPYPSAADDHQRANARVLERAGAAIFMEDENCDGESLASLLETLVPDSDRLAEMSRKALTFRRERVAETIAEYLVGRKAV